MSSRFEITEKRDEDQILAEAQGIIIKEMFYKFPLGGKEVTGISWVGTKEIARKYGGIKMGLPSVTELEDCFVCSIQAEDTKNGVTLVGSNVQSKTMNLRSGEVKPDPFAYIKVVSKAQRNAIRALIPETFLLKMEKAFSEGNHQQTSEPRKEESIVKIPWHGQLGIAEIKQYFIDNDLPGEDFKIRHDESSKMFIIDKAPFVKDFDLLKLLVFEMGGEYDRDHKKTVFRY